jgi:UPF0271 protein
MNMLTIDINCDMGEGAGNDHLLMPFISSANIACGYHAGDADTMLRTCELAVAAGMAIGAHPGFADKTNFGRTEMHLPTQALYDLVTEQVYLLQKSAVACGTVLKHVKPHGALYNMSARDGSIAHTIAGAVKDVDASLVLFGLSGSHSVTVAQSMGLAVANEVFADRTYQNDGSLTPRGQAGALAETTEAAVAQALQMVQRHTVTSIAGKEVPVIADTICIHGDGAHAVSFAEHIYRTFQQHSIGIGKK